jgi:peptidoglycan L-alanyl-D-glutamate endopeptidase CwlK
MKLDSKSLDKLKEVNVDLVSVVTRAAELTSIDFIVTEGLRSIEKQRKLYDSGASRTMNSRHLSGHAVDLAATIDGEVRWDWPLYHKIADAMKTAASDLGISIEWGGDWRYFKDGPHFQLSWKEYP